jgi:hypothetical protein
MASSLLQLRKTRVTCLTVGIIVVIIEAIKLQPSNSCIVFMLACYMACPTHYQTQHFFNNSNTNEDIATKFEQGYVHCVRNEEECVRSVCLWCA